MDLEHVLSAVPAGRSFNVIHLNTALKFDLFPMLSDPFVLIQMQRRRHVDLAPLDMPGVEAALASAEDTVLAKLLWFRAGGELSEKQWHALLGALKVQGRNLEREYLFAWPHRLGVEDLLAKLEEELGQRLSKQD